MTIARLLDLEGVTVCEMALPDDPEHPPPSVDMAVAPRFSLAYLMSYGGEPTIKIVRFCLERRAGDGVLIYRRATGPWG